MGDENRRTTERAEHPPVIYVIDDDEDVREALGRLFGSACFSTRLLSCPREFTIAEGDAPACLVLDVGLHASNGLAFQAELAHRKVEIRLS